MSNIAIKAENLSKAYQLGEIGTGTISRDLERWFARIRGKEDPYLRIGESNDRTSKGTSDIVWSLKDINFEIEEGDAVGIIGRNGAGKSTLLKILSKVTSPTTGKITGKGRIASLLEVGTGFHPELTGRENIFLNGAILGMRKAEIKKHFDAIVDFAGIERYIDTPVKRYSSGMYVRLAFAVAAHLESEILIVDEVLAVGDGDFQKKCLGKMGEVSKGEGRTVLFVSHNMAAVNALCTQGIVLENGLSVFNGTRGDAVTFYQDMATVSSNFEHIGIIESAPGNDNIRILEFKISALHGNLITISSGVAFELRFVNYRHNINLDVTFELRTLDEIVIFHQGNLISTHKDSQMGMYTVHGTLPPNLLNSGIYKFKLIFGEDQRYPLLVKEDFIQFQIENEMEGTNAKPFPGILHYNIPYTTKFDPVLDD
ncbi:MAG TPA: ABC transporter ATP-binding protein [Cytophagaceae bacterium]